MVEDESKKEDEFGIGPTGEVEWISLEQAQVVAMRTARDQPGNYGRRFAETRMVYDVAEEEDREDDYIITLTFRPEGDFAGTPGQEQFFIEKEGIVAHRQVLSLPSRARWWRSRVALVSVGIVVVVAVVVGGVIATIGRDGSGDAVPLAAALPTGTPERPTLIPSPGPTTAAEGIPPVVASPNPVPAPTPTTAVQVLVPTTPTPVPMATPTPGPTPTAASTPVPQQPRLLHWWPGDGNANDLVGRTDGRPQNGATFAPGMADDAFSFDGVDSYVEISNNLPAVMNAITVEAWVNFASLRTIAVGDVSADPIVEVQRWWNDVRGFTLRASGSIPTVGMNRLDFVVQDGVNRGGGSARGPVPETNQWYHVVGTYDGNAVRLYLNGSMVNETAWSGSIPIDNSQPILIGGGANQGRIDGRIDEVAIYNYALGANEVQARYDGGDPAYLLSLHLGEAGEPYEFTLTTGESMQLVADVQDPDGNRVGGSLISWQVAPYVGTIDDHGIFTAGTKAGRFPSGIQVNVVHEGERASAVVDVIVEPGPLADIEIEPTEILVQPGDTATLTAKATDRHGKQMPAELLFLWEAESGIVVDQTGTVTAGEQGGRFEVSAKASYQGGQQTASATVAIPPVWVSAGNMDAELGRPSATLLADGTVLFAGQGPTAVLYIPETRTFRNTGNQQCRQSHTPATLLGNGTVLITGGDNMHCAQVYDPELGTFSRVGDLNAEHTEHTSTLLPDGSVLIAGGRHQQEGTWITHSVAEIHDPLTQIFSATGSLNIDRREHTATLLPSGQVFIAGGIRQDILQRSGVTECLDTAELYSPSTGEFRLITEIMVSTACEPEATLMEDGDVFITSGGGNAMLYDPATETFGATGNPAVSHGRHTNTLLPSGQVLVVGGWRCCRNPPFPLDTVELYDPVNETFSIVEGLNQARFDHTATLLPDGLVLVVGGSSPTSITWRALDSAELWIPRNPQ